MTSESGLPDARLMISDKLFRLQIMGHWNRILLATLLVVAATSCAVDPVPAYWRTVEEANGYVDKREFEEAARRYGLAIEEIRNSPTAPDWLAAAITSSLAYTLTETGQTKEAVALAESALAILTGMPDDDPELLDAKAMTWAALGWALEKDDRLEEAETAYRNALRIGANKHEWSAMPATEYYGLAVVYVRKGDIDRADKHFELAMSFINSLDRRQRSQWAYYVQRYEALRRSFSLDHPDKSGRQTTSN